MPGLTITQALLAEHVVYHHLFDSIEQAVPQLKTLREIQALARLLESMLSLHAKAEDTLLIEPLQPAFSQLGQEENFHAEHDDIDRDIRAAQTVRQIRKAKDLLLRAVMLSRKHFDKEERLVFPLAEKQLSPRSQKLLGERWAKQRHLI